MGENNSNDKPVRAVSFDPQFDDSAFTLQQSFPESEGMSVCEANHLIEKAKRVSSAGKTDSMAYI
ncbi:hypothetical protein [Caldalkalibacillus salinus]|uniref:hypothetical protein n=1 Tax=Caldalkalibacillus salinus TaxID=2803787 RepID=UPI0019250ACB|nr:hypothetical protein [Caldalkalibacillus salinus]